MSEQLAGAQTRGVAPYEGGEEDPDGDPIGGDQESEQRDARISHPSGAQLGERRGEQQDYE